jgi:transcription elongation factor GreA
VTTTPASTTPINGHDLLYALGLGIEGPVLWGHPVSATGPGVFLIELPTHEPKVSIDPTAVRDWIERAPDLRLDGKRPTVAELQSRLASFWLPRQVILYIGSSQRSVGARLASIYRTPLGERRPQPSGYWLKTLKDINKARIWWVETAEAELYEDQLLETFMKSARALPYGVLTSPAGVRRETGIVNALHDSEIPKLPPRGSKVTLFPDADGAEGTKKTTTRAPRKPTAKALAKASARPEGAGSAIETPKPVRGAAARAAARAAAKGPALPPIHLTTEGLVALRAELEELTTLRRPEVISRIKSARELGDLRENADYEAARKEQSFLEGRVLQLEQMIKHAVIIDQSASGIEVVLGSTVVVETDRHGPEKFTIVGSAEADAQVGKISYTSPIGRALMGRRAGETVRVQVPAGAVDFKVVEVS